MIKKLILIGVMIFCIGVMSGQSLTLQWTNSVTEGVTGYNLYRSETAGSGYEKVNPVLILPTFGSVIEKTEFTDITVKYNKRYYYVCRAVMPWSDPAGDNGILESINSNEATEYIMPPAPNAPTGLIKKSLQP